MSSLSDAQLLERAVRAAHVGRRSTRRQRHVMQALLLASVLLMALPACVLGAMLPVFLCARLLLSDTKAAVAFTIEYHRAAARHAVATLLWVGEVSRARLAG